MRALALGLLVAVPMAFNAVALLPEVVYPAPNVNDDAEHILFIQQSAAAWDSGQNPVDMWVPQLELGYPQFLYYQHLPHLVIVVLGKLTFGLFSLRTLFDLVRYLLLVAFPLTVFWSMRRLGLSAVAAAIGAAAASLLSGSSRYGFEYDSYIWRGLGVYTQIFGMHLSFIAFALLYRVATRGGGLIAAALACAALALSHLIYAYMTAITAIVVLLFGMTRANAIGRLGRFGAVGGLAGAVASYMWIPFFVQGGYANVSPYLEREKYDSFGAPTILGWLVTGDLFDHGRLPVLTLLLAAGIVAALVTRARVAILSLVLFLVWLVLYFGRPTLGPLADLLPLHDGLLFHRFIGGVDLFAIVLIGIGGAWIWERLRAEATPRRLAAVAAGTALLFLPALAERWSYYGENATWLRTTQAAIGTDADARTVLDALRAQPPGRAYAGLRSNWGRTLDFGIPFNSVRMYNLLASEGRDAVAPPYRDASLNADMLWDFNDQDVAEYRLFDVSYVIAPPSVSLPRELSPIVTTSKYVLYAAPGGGYAEYAGIARSEAPRTQLDLFLSGRTWLRAGEASRWSLVRYEYQQRAPVDVPVPIADCSDQQISYERVQPARVDVLAGCSRDSAMVLKMTFHPNWHVTVDGREVTTFMASPSLLAFALPAGQHFITAEYRSAPLKAWLLAAGALTLLGLAVYALRGRWRTMLDAARDVPRWRDDVRRWGDLVRRRPVATTLGLTTATLILCWLFTTPIAFNGGLGNDGRIYSLMVSVMRDHLAAQPAPPWVYRLLPPALVALTPLDVVTGFVLMNIASTVVSAYLLLVFLRRYAITGGLALLAIGWWLALPMGLRWSLYYPVLPDALGFALLMGVILAALGGRSVLFAVLLAIAVLARENLLMMIPFFWLAMLGRGMRRATILTAAAALPAVAVFLYVRLFPVIQPAPVYDSWLASHRIDVNIERITQNVDAHAWRYVLAAPLSLGLLFAIPLARWRGTVTFLGRELHWLYYTVATFGIAIIGGWDDDRYLYPLAPLLLVLVFGLSRDLFARAWEAGLLTALQVVAVRFLWPYGVTERDYFQYVVAFMDQSRLWTLALIDAVTFAVAAAVIQLFKWSARSTVGFTMLHQSRTRRILE